MGAFGAFASTPVGIVVLSIAAIFLAIGGTNIAFPREGEYVTTSTSEGTEDEYRGGRTRRIKKKGTHRK